MMLLEYDAEANAAYLRLAPSGVQISWTHQCDPSEVDAMINIDFGPDGRIVGIEILDARSVLYHELLE